MGSPVRGSITLLAATILVVCALAADARANVVIDNFDQAAASPGSWPLVCAVTPGSTGVVETGLTTVLGGARATSLSAQQLDIAGLDQVSSALFTSAGILDYTSSSGSRGQVLLGYGAQAAGGTTLNIATALTPTLNVNFLDYDDPNGQPLSLQLTLFSGSASQSFAGQTLASGTQTVSTFRVFPARLPAWNCRLTPPRARTAASTPSPSCPNLPAFACWHWAGWPSFGDGSN